MKKSILTLLFIFIFSCSSNDKDEYENDQSFYEDIPATSNQLASTSKSHYLVLEAIEKNDVGTILLDDSNFKNASSSYKFLFNMFTPSINIKFVPNIVGFISRIINADAFLVFRILVFISIFIYISFYCSCLLKVS